MIKTTGHITIKQIRLAVIFSILAFFSAVFLFVAVNKAGAASYGYVGLSAGFSGAGCPGDPNDWVAISGHLYDSATHAPIAGTFQVQCKYDHKSSAISYATGCLNLGPGPYFCEGPDPTHPGWSWFAIRCRGWQAAGSGGAVCMGGCSLPFRLKATAPGYFNSPTWLANHGASSGGAGYPTLYPEGNRNTAHFNIFLDKIPVAQPTNTLRVRSSNPSSGVPISGSQPGTSGTTPYNVVTQSNISTWLTAPPLASGGARRFWKWTGCEHARPVWNRACDAVVVNGQVQTVTAYYINNVSTLRVNSTGASGVPISGSQGGTGGTTNYTRQRNGTTHTWLTAPRLVASNTKKFHSWNSGCAVVSGRSCLTPAIAGGQTHTVNVHYVHNLGWIQGYKIRAPTKVAPGDRCVQNPAPGYPCSHFPPSHERVNLQGSSWSSRANPYSTGWIMYGWKRVSVTAPAGWRVSYRRCVNGANCTGRIIGQAVWVNVPPGGYVDLWWYYHPLNLIVNPLGNSGEQHVGDKISGVQVVVRNTGVKRTPRFRLQFCKNGTAAYKCLGSWTQSWWFANGLGPGQTVVKFVDPFTVPDPGAGKYPKTYRMIARADLDIAKPGRVVEDIEISDNRSRGTYKVIGPPPWFHTRGGGDVGSYEKIEPKTAPTGVGYTSADYLVISNSTIKNFTSARKWLVPSYSSYNGINLKPAPVGGSIYQAMFNKYTKQCLKTVNAKNPGPIRAAAKSCNILLHHKTNLTINSVSWYPPPKGYTGRPAVVFVNGNMSIRSNMAVGADNGLIFVVKGNITVAKKVIRADGVYLFDGNYDVKARKHKNEDQLLVKGSVIGAFNNGRFRLDRDFRSIRSRHEPTEIFEFQARYLWLFRDFLGDEKTRFDEVAP